MRLGSSSGSFGGGSFGKLWNKSCLFLHMAPAYCSQFRLAAKAPSPTALTSPLGERFHANITGGIKPFHRSSLGSVPSPHNPCPTDHSLALISLPAHSRKDKYTKGITFRSTVFRHFSVKQVPIPQIPQLGISSHFLLPQHWFVW